MTHREIGYIVTITVEFLLIIIFGFMAFKKDKTFLSDLYNSFKNNPQGFSAKKLTAFTMVCMLVHLHYRVSDQVAILRLVALDMLFILLLFGIIVLNQVVDLIGVIKGNSKTTVTSTASQNNTTTETVTEKSPEGSKTNL